MWFIGVPVKNTQMQYDSYETPFARVTFTVILQRKPSYYVMNIIVPSIVFSLLTIITLMLQPGCSDRIGLGLYSHYSEID